MGRWTKDHVLEVGAAVGVAGLVLMLLSYVYRFADAPGWLGFYESALAAIPGAEPAGYNLWVMILSTILFVSGAFYAGEQIVLRRRFERLLATSKKSEFVSNRKDLDVLVRRLPGGYRQRVKEKELTFKSAR